MNTQQLFWVMFLDLHIQHTPTVNATTKKYKMFRELLETILGHEKVFHNDSVYKVFSVQMLTNWVQPGGADNITLMSRLVRVYCTQI